MRFCTIKEYKELRIVERGLKELEREREKKYFVGRYKNWLKIRKKPMRRRRGLSDKQKQEIVARQAAKWMEEYLTGGRYALPCHLGHNANNCGELFIVYAAQKLGFSYLLKCLFYASYCGVHEELTNLIESKFRLFGPPNRQYWGLPGENYDEFDKKEKCYMRKWRK